MAQDTPLPTPGGRQPEDDEPVATLRAVQDSDENGATVTFYPADVSADRLPTAWLTIDADSLCDLAAMR